MNETRNDPVARRNSARERNGKETRHNWRILQFPSHFVCLTYHLIPLSSLHLPFSHTILTTHYPFRSA